MPPRKTARKRSVIKKRQMKQKPAGKIKKKPVKKINKKSAKTTNKKPVKKKPAPGTAGVRKITAASVEPHRDLLGVGLDMGTANIVAMRETERGEERKHARNAFLFVREDDSTKELLARMNIPQKKIKERVCVLGQNAFDFSNYFERSTQRPMNVGVINPLEREAIHVMDLIVQQILWKPRVPNEICCFCVPAQPVDSNTDILYHRNVIETMLSCLGYKVFSLNEGFAVVLSELKDKKFTGMGISCGGGMTNVCLVYKAVIIQEFSIAQGGDYIDQCAANALDMPINKITRIKEKGMSIVHPEDREQEVIALFYKKYINYFLTQISNVFHAPDKAPQFDDPIDVIFAGGSTLISGFIEVVRHELKTIDLGIPINEPRKAADPFFCVAKGCLSNARHLTQ